MLKLRQGSAKSTHWVPKASFAPILLNFGCLWVTPVDQKEAIGTILGTILRPKWPTWRYQVQIMSSFGGQFGIKMCSKIDAKINSENTTKNDVNMLEKVVKFRSKTCAKTMLSMISKNLDFCDTSAVKTSLCKCQRVQNSSNNCKKSMQNRCSEILYKHHVNISKNDPKMEQK